MLSRNCVFLFCFDQFLVSNDYMLSPLSLSYASSKLPVTRSPVAHLPFPGFHVVVELQRLFKPSNLEVWFKIYLVDGFHFLCC